jgi:hypothetical protein
MAGRVIDAIQQRLVVVVHAGQQVDLPAVAGTAGAGQALPSTATARRGHRPGRNGSAGTGGGSLRQFGVAAAASGLMWANMLRPFQVGKALTSHEGPWSWIRESRVASAQDSCPACHLTNASASAVM